MRIVLSAMPAFLRQSFATMFQYRGEIVLWAIWGVVYPAVSMAMWSAAVHGSPNGQMIGRFTARDFAGYFWLTMVIGHITTAWDVYQFGYEVRSGRLSSQLLRPLLPVWQRVADNVAYKALTLTVLVPIWLCVVALMQPTFHGDRGDLAMSVPAAALAVVINFVWCYNLALSAFWITRIDAVGQAWFGLSLFFGGRLAPLTIMPEPLQRIASALPFKWVIWFPSELLMGHLSDRAVRSGMVNQLAWIALGLVVFQVLWRRGVKRYSAVGA